MTNKNAPKTGHPPTPDSTESVPSTPPRQGTSRRSWLGSSAAVAAAGALGYPLLQYAGGCSKHEQPNKSDEPKQVVVCGREELGPDQMRIVHHGGKPIIVYRVGDAPPVARSAKCTHMGCTVRYRPQKRDLNCACHNAIYDAKTGQVVSGPAPKGLEAYPVQFKDGKIVVEL